MKYTDLKVTGRNEFEKKEVDMVTLRLVGDGLTVTLTGSADDIEEYQRHELVDLELRQSQTKLVEAVETLKEKMVEAFGEVETATEKDLKDLPELCEPKKDPKKEKKKASK
jgi:aspartate ammonia-lyase